MWPFRSNKSIDKALSPAPTRGGWWPLAIHESFTGAWQRGVVLDDTEDLLGNSSVFACITLIASDIGKLRPKLTQRQGQIWVEAGQSPFRPVLRSPNAFQTWAQFAEAWIATKLTHGNTYALKFRDERGIVTGLRLLASSTVTPLVSDSGVVFYRLRQDNIGAQPETEITVPASEIIHDRMNCLFHPLVGISPLRAAALPATVARKIGNSAATFFGNGARPGGILVAPGAIAEDTAKRLKEHWETNYSDRNQGRVAVLGDGLKFEPMAIPAVDAQLIEQQRWTAADIARAFRVPPFKLGLEAPGHANVAALNQQYYDHCIGGLIESLESCLDDGLRLPQDMRVELDLGGLLRMDPATQYTALGAAVKDGLLTPNEARRQLDLPPLVGGDTVYLQQQMYSLEALAKRDEANPLENSKSEQRSLFERLELRHG